MIIGIGGVSRAGKTKLARRLQKYFRQQGRSVRLLHQDEFVFPESEIPKVKGRVDWEHPGSIDFSRFRESIVKASQQYDVVIAEGLMAFCDEETNRLYEKCFFVEISKPTFLRRKAADQRWGEEPEWYVEHIWESYLKYGVPVEWPAPVLRLSGEVRLDWEAAIRFLEKGPE